MKGALIFTIILLAFSLSWERLILNYKSKNGGKLKPIDNSVFKNRTRFINSRKSRIVYGRGNGSRKIYPNSYKRRIARLNRFPNGKSLFLCPHGRKCSTPRRIKSSINPRYRYRYQY